MANPRITKTQINAIITCLDLGIPIDMPDRGRTRTFRTGEITRDVKSNYLRTTHRTPDMMNFVWLNAYAVAHLARQAEEKLARKDEILAKMAADRQAFLDS